MTVHATYNGEEIYVTFSAETERWDYGVPRSPVYTDVNLDTIRVDSIAILGEDYKLTDLPEKLQAAILALADELEFE